MRGSSKCSIPVLIVTACRPAILVRFCAVVGSLLVSQSIVGAHAESVNLGSSSCSYNFYQRGCADAEAFGLLFGNGFAGRCTGSFQSVQKDGTPAFGFCNTDIWSDDKCLSNMADMRHYALTGQCAADTVSAGRTWYMENGYPDGYQGGNIVTFGPGSVNEDGAYVGNLDRKRQCVVILKDKPKVWGISPVSQGNYEYVFSEGACSVLGPDHPVNQRRTALGRRSPSPPSDVPDLPDSPRGAPKVNPCGRSLRGQVANGALGFAGGFAGEMAAQNGYGNVAMGVGLGVSGAGGYAAGGIRGGATNLLSSGVGIGAEMGASGLGLNETQAAAAGRLAGIGTSFTGGLGGFYTNSVGMVSSDLGSIGHSWSVATSNGMSTAEFAYTTASLMPHYWGQMLGW